ncbi:N-formylglutamate amidohydrolase [Acetobacter sp. AN02]|uniref:N-formylglutamate amidohydrolase n=1 Tax=Acetobacter sp. AN02 TaxID=2894186 RepID=UPI0024345BBB|nr:N-formylglutamate amidohydrolase [Acetobacter sp. AN02]MDG6095644.1 N-formylglutamate amidohydrolase [Acetobacter sp. AN02]
MPPSDIPDLPETPVDQGRTLIPVVVERPATQPLPLVISLPHSGRAYQESFISRTRLTLSELRSGEDAFVDLLAADTPGLGATLIQATFPRVVCDVNRAPLDVDPSEVRGAGGRFFRPGARARAGLGSIPAVVSGGKKIYARPLSFPEVSSRLNEMWKPYHKTLHGLLREMRDHFGICVLLDLHSMMPGLCEDQAEFVIGDRFGQSSDQRFVAAIEDSLREAGADVRRNRPFAGGFITEHYGSPGENIHAVQIEIRQDLYMHGKEAGLSTGFARTRGQISALTQRLGWELTATG